MDNPYELLYMSRMCDDWSQTALFLQFRSGQKSLINTVIARYRPLQIYREDLFQEADLAMVYALEGYREDQSCGFRTFLSLVTQRRVWTLLRHYSAESYVQMHDVMDLENTVSETESFYDAIQQKDRLAEPEYCFHFHDAGERLQAALEELNAQEQNILQAWTEGESYQNASMRLGLGYKAYDGKLQRVRKKIKNAVMQ